MFKTLQKYATTLCLLAVVSPAFAQAPAAERAMNHALAKTAVDAAEASARSNGWNLTIVVTDEAGIPVMVQRMDGASAGSWDYAMRKVTVVAATGLSSGEYGQKLQAGEVAEVENGVTFAGGVPVMRNGKMIGIIATSGARAVEDEVVSLAGAAAIAD